MKVCIFHGLHNCHFEMFGYLIEYFINNHIEFDVYSFINEISTDWKKYYNNIFNNQINWKNIINFNDLEYNYIFLTTDDDKIYNINQNIFNNISKTKIFCIDHYYLIRNPSVFYRVGVRFFINRPSCKWILPCYNVIFKKEKKLLLEKENKINITSIGTSYPKSISFLKKLFLNYDDITFNIITRKYNNELDNESNIFIYEMCPTQKMTEIVARSHYILCNDESIDYENKGMSGVIPLSFSYGCQLILPKSWNRFYSFISPIEYDKYTSIMLDKNINLDAIYNELYFFINQKQNIISTAINYNYTYTIPILKHLKSFELNVPSILIDFNSNIDLISYKKDFTEIHTLTKSINKNHFIYEYDNEDNLLKFLINNIINSVILFFDFNKYTNNVQELINLICKTKRLINDIIIVRNINKNDDVVQTIIKATKKFVWSDFYDNSLFIIPQTF